MTILNVIKPNQTRWSNNKKLTAMQPQSIDNSSNIGRHANTVQNISKIVVKNLTKFIISLNNWQTLETLFANQI